MSQMININLVLSDFFFTETGKYWHHRTESSEMFGSQCNIIKKKRKKGQHSLSRNSFWRQTNEALKMLSTASLAPISFYHSLWCHRVSTKETMKRNWKENMNIALKDREGKKDCRLFVKCSIILSLTYAN